MRLKNIKDAPKIVYSSSYVIKNPLLSKNNWSKIFQNDNPIEIEIGMGKGAFIIQKALNNPDINYIGIEKYLSVLVSAVKKLEEENIKNLKIICMDAINISEVFDKEISKIYLNFSDPWPKKKHQKRRLTSQTFLDLYSLIFKDKFCIEMKTDNDELFDYSLNMFKENNFKIEHLSRNYNSLYKTEYESKFINKGKNINYVKVNK